MHVSFVYVHTVVDDAGRDKSPSLKIEFLEVGMLVHLYACLCMCMQVSCMYVHVCRFRVCMYMCM